MDARTRRDFLRRAALAFPALHAFDTLASFGAERSRANRPVHLRELVFRTRKMDAQVEFYTRKLEFPLVERGKGRVTLRGGTTLLTFVDAGDAKEDPFHHVAFNIPENKIRAAIEWSKPRFDLIRRGRPGDPIVHFEAIDAHSVYFFDAAGNLLEFIARHELPNAAPGSFTAADILNASEIGIVVDDVPGTVGWLEAEFGLPRYPAGRSVSDVFSMSGDANGVFIVVKRGRLWLMTDTPGRVFPTEVVLAGDSASERAVTGFPYVIRTTRSG